MGSFLHNPTLNTQQINCFPPFILTIHSTKELIIVYAMGPKSNAKRLSNTSSTSNSRKKATKDEGGSVEVHDERATSNLKSKQNSSSGAPPSISEIAYDSITTLARDLWAQQQVRQEYYLHSIFRFVNLVNPYRVHSILESCYKSTKKKLRVAIDLVGNCWSYLVI